MVGHISARQIHAIQERVAQQHEAIVNFLIELVAIPSYDGMIEPVAMRIAHEMKQLGFSEVRFDRMGNILGRIGNGNRVLIYDTHIDTVGIGDASAWKRDPFKGKIEEGIFYARGACDAKGSTPGMIYGLAIAQDLGFLENVTYYFFGNIAEDCDGLAPNVLVELEGIHPDFVVIGAPTRLQIHCGHKGRAEIEVVVKGKSVHSAVPFLGDNAIYKMISVIEGVRELNAMLPNDLFLGKGHITVTHIESCAPHITAVPEECRIIIDRRLILGEKRDEILSQLQALLFSDQFTITIHLLHYDRPSYTGFVFPVDKFFPAWALPQDHPLVQAGVTTAEILWRQKSGVGKWNVSTNGTYWTAKANIPSIGFGPGDEMYAHSVLDQIPLDEVVRATEWYAAFPGVLRDMQPRPNCIES